jgi:hypothetical protein
MPAENPSEPHASPTEPVRLGRELLSLVGQTTVDRAQYLRVSLLNRRVRRLARQLRLRRPPPLPEDRRALMRDPQTGIQELSSTHLTYIRTNSGYHFCPTRDWLDWMEDLLEEAEALAGGPESGDAPAGAVASPPGTGQGEGGTPTESQPSPRPNKPSRDRQDDILAAITAAGTPLTRPELVRQMRLRTEGRLGHQLAWMTTKGILVNIPRRGYWPADRPVPE